MHKLLKLTCFVFAATASLVDGLAQPAKPQITVSGTATTRVAPDEVVLTAAIESRARSVSEAARDNEQKISAVLAFLKTMAVVEKDVRTEFIGISPLYASNHRTPKANYQMQQQSSGGLQISQATGSEEEELPENIQPIGFSVRRQFSIRLTDLTRFEAVYKGLVENGINNVNGIQFESSRLQEIRNEVRLEAIRAARDKAKTMAGELGASLASVISITEAEDSMSRFPMMANTLTIDPSAGESGGFAAGQISISARVLVVFELGNPEMTRE